MNENLSEREVEVWRLLASGKCNKEVADIFGTSIKTVDNQRTSLYLKLGVHDVTALVRRAVEHLVIIVEIKGPLVKTSGHTRTPHRYSLPRSCSATPAASR